MKILITKYKYQQKYLWFEIILKWFAQNYAEKFALINNTAYCWKLANKALAAYELLINTKIDIEKYLFNQENYAFATWLKEYKLISKQADYIPEDLNNLEHNIYNKNIKYFQISCKDFIEEVHKAATWAKRQIAGNRNRLGVLIPRIEHDVIKSQVDYIFSNLFADHQYRICVPQKLCNYQAIKIILLLLKLINCYLNNHNLNYEDFSILLKSKFIIGFNEEYYQRHYIDYLLRVNIEAECSWQALVYKINNINTNADMLLKLLNNLQQEIAKLSGLQHNCNDWVNFCNNILIISGILNNCDEALIKNWNNLLAHYNQLALYLNKHDLSTVIKIITYLAEDLEDINTENTGVVDNNINIINVNTALAQQFDYIWICGANDTYWLEDHQFNPFIPIAVQQQLQDTNENILQKISHNITTSLICSYCKYIDNNLARPNRLINNFNNLEVINNSSNIDKLQLEYYQDNTAPAYNNTLFSGVSFLKLQAICPFKANAKIRLRAEGLKSPAKFLDPITKGQIIHKCMELFWLKYPQLDILKEISADNIYKQLLLIVVNVLNNYKLNKPNVFNDIIIQVESTRIASLCANFIKECDLSRKDSFTIKYIEQAFTVQLKEYSIKIKIDRIDNINNTEDLIIIDYKTGRSLINLNNLEDPRLPEPQLLIYSLCLAKVRQLMLGIINEQPKWLAVNNWLEHKDIWYENLYKLANDFKHGNVAVDPKYGEQTCRLCDLQYMCRVCEKN